MDQPYIVRSYKNAIITIVLLAVGFVLYLISEVPLGNQAVAIIVTIVMLIAMVTAVRGMIQLYKGRKEGINSKFIIALIGNGLGILYLILTLIMAITIFPKVL